MATASAAVNTAAGTFVVRTFGWGMLALMAAFLINNFAVLGFGAPPAALSGAGLLLATVYVVAIALTVLLVMQTTERELRADAALITGINTWFIRGAFFAVFFVGLGDAVISFLRVEGILGAVVGEELARGLGRSNFRGPYVHMPLVALGFLLAFFTRTLGFIWLALLIVLAELLIVISRFVFSYEQAFMGDLVRFWYAALFLFASAYTLLEDGHVRVDVLYAGMGPSTKGMINAWGSVLLGISLCWVILIMGMGARTSIINAPMLSFEVTQSGVGMYVKYMMAAFLGVFAVSMMMQFCAYLLESVADWRDEPGRQERLGAAGH